ncbi:hypothetical protein Peur_023370 [Populus x canadensis]
MYSATEHKKGQQKKKKTSVEIEEDSAPPPPPPPPSFPPLLSSPIYIILVTLPLSSHVFHHCHQYTITITISDLLISRSFLLS